MNLPDDGPAFAATAAAHVQPEGVVIGQTYPPGFDRPPASARCARSAPRTSSWFARSASATASSRPSATASTARNATQSFTTVLLDEAALRALLAEADLTFDRWLDRPGWFLARPM